MRTAFGHLRGKLEGAAMRVHARETQGVALKRDSLASWDDDFDELEDDAIDLLGVATGSAFDTMAVRLRRMNAGALRKVGVALDPRGEGHVSEAIRRAREANIQLVEKAGRAYAQDVRDIFTDPDTFGLRPEELRAQLIDRGSVGFSRADLISRDQTLKLNGAITKARHEAAGIERYVWSTSMDERVREEHKDLEGQVFSWDSPPEPGHPGEDYQCRCTPVPVLEEENDTDEDLTF